jgi:hypothetical protein
MHMSTHDDEKSYDFVTMLHLLHSSSPSALCFQHRAHLLLAVLDSAIRTGPRVAVMSETTGLGRLTKCNFTFR